MIDNQRKIKMTFSTTPTELRDIANKLEKYREVNVNWYHTVLTFTDDNSPSSYKLLDRAHKPN